MKEFSLKDKVVLITGSEGQLGMSFVHFLLKSGAKVIGLASVDV